MKVFTDLATERLLLKCVSDDDAEFFFREFSNDDVNRYLYDADPCTSQEEAGKWIDFYTEPEPRNQHRRVMVRRDSGESIGTCGFHCWNRETGEAEIGYDVYPTHWRQGYMTEALTRIIEFAKDNMSLERIDAHISVNHIPSIRTALKQGFHKSGESYFEEFHGERYLHDVYRLFL